MLLMAAIVIIAFVVCGIIFRKKKEGQQEQNTIILIGDAPSYLTESLKAEIKDGDGSPVIIKIKPDDIPGLLEGDDEGHTMVWQRAMQALGYSVYSTCLWENGATESPFYRDLPRELERKLSSEYGFDTTRIYAVEYKAHLGCECLELQPCDCRGSALNVLFPMAKICSFELARV